MAVEFTFKEAENNEETKERFSLVEHYAKTDYDKEYLYTCFGCVPLNCRHPMNILNACDVLRDYKFSDLFEEVNLSDILHEVDDDENYYWVFGNKRYGNTERVKKYNVCGYYLILTPNDFLMSNTPTQFNDYDKIYVLNDGTRLFKPKFDVDESNVNFEVNRKNKTKEKRLAKYIECLADIISSVGRVYYPNDSLNDVISNMTLKFVPTNIVDGKEILSANGLLAFRYNEVM